MHLMMPMLFPHPHHFIFRVKSCSVKKSKKANVKHLTLKLGLKTNALMLGRLKTTNFKI